MSLDTEVTNTPNIIITYNNIDKKVTPIQSCDTLVDKENDKLISIKDKEFETYTSPPLNSELNFNTLKSKNLSKCGLVRFESTKDISFSQDCDYDPYGTDIQSEEENEEAEEQDVVKEGEISNIVKSSSNSEVESLERDEGKNENEEENTNKSKSEEALVVFKRVRPSGSGFKPTVKNETLLEKIASWFNWSYSSKSAESKAKHIQPMSVPLKTVTKTGAVATLTTTTTLAMRPKSGLFEYKDNGEFLVDNIEFSSLETKPVQYKFNGELRGNWDRIKENTIDLLPSTSSGSSGGPGLVQRLIVKALLSPTRNNLHLPTKDQFYRLMTKIPRPLTIAFTSNGQSFDTLKLIEEDKERKRRSFRVKQNYFDNNEDFEIRNNKDDELKIVELKEIDKDYRPRVVITNS